MIQNKPRLFAVVILWFVSVLPWGCRSSTEPIVIGIVGPFSQVRGRSMRLAAELAVREINDNGGVNGRPLRLSAVDDSAQTASAIRAATVLRDDPSVVAVVGHLTSGTTLAAAPIYHASNNPVVSISPSASNPAVSDAGPYTFRVCPTDAEHGSALAEWARTALGARRAAVIYSNDPYGRGIAEAFRVAFEEDSTGEVVTHHSYLLEIPDFTPYVLRAIAADAEVVMLAGTTDGAEQLLPAIEAVGFDGRILAGDGATGIQDRPVNADGMLISSPYLADRESPANVAFVSAYRDAYQNQTPDHRGAGAYDIIYLLREALAAVGTNRSDIRDYLAGVGTRTAPFAGVTGSIAFDDNGDVVGKNVVIGEVNQTLMTVRR